MVVNILPADPSYPHPTLGVGSECQNLTFSEHGHAAHQINGITNVATWKQKFASQTPPRDPGGQKVKIQNIVMLHIKGNRECSNMVANADRGTINKKNYQT